LPGVDGVHEGDVDYCSGSKDVEAGFQIVIATLSTLDGDVLPGGGGGNVKGEWNVYCYLSHPYHMFHMSCPVEAEYLKWQYGLLQLNISPVK
jgi:hypothetical protein